MEIWKSDISRFDNRDMIRKPVLCYSREQDHLSWRIYWEEKIFISSFLEMVLMVFKKFVKIAKWTQ